ncbi:MAG: tRNA pseudouridine(55) synthase TruB [Clostridia bacterium]
MEKQNIDGIFVLNKPAGISSNSAVNKVKYMLNAKKAGHYGTLDPLGMGVLPVALGKATKLFDLFLKKTKEYKTVYKFGEETTTLDTEGEVTNKNDVIVTKKMIEDILPKFVGKIEQIPPAFSAKKIGGHKAYELARKGIKVQLPPKLIEIFSIKLISQIAENVFELIINCSSGTYIRSLARDIAYAIGTYGTMQSIVRTRCGVLCLKDAYTFEDIENGTYKIISYEQAEKLL